MSDWNDFQAEITWGVRTRVLNVGPEGPAHRHGFAPSGQLMQTFPRLVELLSKARITPLETKEGRYQLFGWDRKAGGTCGWLSPVRPVDRRAKVELYPDHQALLGHFGGVLERWNDPPQTSLLRGVASALTEDESGIQSEDWHPHYVELCDEEGVAPIVASGDDYAVFVVEGNSNRTLCHRTSGEVIYFAPDPAPQLDVQILDGAPEYTLYRIVGVPHFVSWVETLAGQWLDATT